MFCTVCEAEYEAGITHCPDDNTALVERLTPENTLHDLSEARFVELQKLGSPAEAEMVNDHAVWREIATRHKLVEADLGRIASPWHTDLDLGRPIEVMTDMANSRRLGFTAWQATEDSFYDLFSELRARLLIP